MDKIHTLEHYKQMADEIKRTCSACRHAEYKKDENFEYWKCRAPKGDIHYFSMVDGKQHVKRIWVYCQGERSPSSTGCGTEGNWWEPK